MSNHLTKYIEKWEAEDATRAVGSSESTCSAHDRVSIDRNALKVLCRCAAALCRKSNPERIEDTRRALKRTDKCDRPQAPKPRGKRPVSGKG